jgi:hypothetical protein
LTFNLPKEPEVNIVPCLLPEQEPEVGSAGFDKSSIFHQFDWPVIEDKNAIRELRLIYKFDYLPAGLFNRAQVIYPSIQC